MKSKALVILCILTFLWGCHHAVKKDPWAGFPVLVVGGDILIPLTYGDATRVCFQRMDWHGAACYRLGDIRSYLGSLRRTN